jgi:phosphoribosylanthranilate isomerase
MTPIDVKICGIGTPADYDTCFAAGAAFIGMVFFEKSPRHLTNEQAMAIRDHARAVGGAAAPRRVALSVNMNDSQIKEVVEAADPHLLQLHGDETPERAAALKTRFGLPIIKAIRIATAEDLAASKMWDGAVDWLLFDAKGDPNGLPGGTGHHFDWRLLADHKGQTKWMLAGGLSPDNVAQAVAITNARALDVSSGVESAPGKKDPRLIHAFVSAAQIG